MNGSCGYGPGASRSSSVGDVVFGSYGSTVSTATESGVLKKTPGPSTNSWLVRAGCGTQKLMWLKPFDSPYDNESGISPAPSRLAMNANLIPMPQTVSLSPHLTKAGVVLSTSKKPDTRSGSVALPAFSNAMARALMSARPEATPSTVAYPPPSLSTRATLASVLVHWNSTLPSGSSSPLPVSGAPISRQARAWTVISSPSRRTSEGVSMVTYTSGLLSSGKAHVTPTSATASITTGVARWKPRIQSNP